MVLTINQHEIDEMKRFVEQDLGLEFRYDAMINPRVDGSRERLRLRLTPQEIVALDVRDPVRGEEWRTLAKRISGTHRGAEPSTKLYQCGGGLTSFAIDPYGNMGVCTLSQHNRWNLRGGAFKTGWNEFLSHLREKKLERPSKCISCGIRDTCTMCPVNGELENDDPETPVDYFCRIAHLRAYALNIPVGPHGRCEYCKNGNDYQRLMDEATALRSRAEKEEIGITE